MKFIELKRHLKTQLLPSYVLAGDDSYLMQLASEMLYSLVTELSELNISRFSGDTPAEEIVAACEGYPIMSDRRIVAVTDFLGAPEPLLKYLSRPNNCTVLLFIQNSLTSNLTKILPLSEVVDCARLEEEVIVKWIAQNIEGSGTLISSNGATLLIKYCNRFLSRVDGELKKLISYKSGGTIESADVQEMVSPDIEYKIFELSEALVNKDGEKVTNVLNSLSATTQITSFMGLLYAHFRRLLYCAINKDTPENLATALSVKEYAVKIAIRQAKMFSPVRLKKICDSFHKADFDFKSGLITDNLALETFIFSVLNEGQKGVNN